MSQQSSSTDVDWKQYFLEYQDSRRDDAIDLRASVRPSKVTVAGHEIDTSLLGGRTDLGRFAKLGAEFGWLVKAGESTWFSGDTFIESRRAVKEGVEEAYRWVNLAKPGYRLMASSLKNYVTNGSIVTKEEFEERIRGGNENSFL